MHTTIIGMLATSAGTAMAVVGLVSRSVGNLRSHMDERIDSVRAELGGRIETLETRLARIGDDVAFIKGQLATQPDGWPTKTPT